MENYKDNNKDLQLNSLLLMEYIIRKPIGKKNNLRKSAGVHDPAVEKLHHLREQIKNEQ